MFPQPLSYLPSGCIVPQKRLLFYVYHLSTEIFLEGASIAKYQANQHNCGCSGLCIRSDNLEHVTYSDILEMFKDFILNPAGIAHNISIILKIFPYNREMPMFIRPYVCSLCESGKRNPYPPAFPKHMWLYHICYSSYCF